MRQPPARHHAFLEGDAGVLQTRAHGLKIIAPEGDMIEGSGAVLGLGKGLFAAPGPGGIGRFHQMDDGHPAQIKPMAAEGESRTLAINQAHQIDIEVAGARQVLLPPAPDVGLVDAAWFYLWHGDMLRQPDGRTLQQALPEPLATRFAAAAALTGKDASGYAGDVPLVAAMRLQRDFLSSRDLDRREPRQTVERLARCAHIPVRRMGEFDLMPTVRAVLALPESRQRPCLEQAIDDTFRQARDAAAAAEAWADGDIAGVEAHYAETKLLECVAAVSPQAAGVNALSVELIVKAMDKALAEGGKSAAVLSIGPLLRQGGVLEQLAAQGVTISQPQ